MAGSQTSENEEDTLRRQIKELRERERRLREERHRLEAKLRELIFRKYLELEEKIETSAQP